MKNGAYEMVVAPPGYPGLRYRGKYCYEHHLVWWAAHGSLPEHNKTAIHHVNGNKRDNALANLSLVTVREHNHEHQPGSVRCVVLCNGCGKQFIRAKRKLSLFLTGRAKYVTCSSSCIPRAMRSPVQGTGIVGEYKLYVDGHIEHPPYSSSGVPEDLRPKQSDLNREQRQMADIADRIENPTLFICPVCGGEKPREYSSCSPECAAKAREKVAWAERQELEKLVWETPVTTLASRLGVSDAAIHKRCRRLGIRTPPRGYWAKQATGE